MSDAFEPQHGIDMSWVLADRPEFFWKLQMFERMERMKKQPTYSLGVIARWRQLRRKG